MRVANTMEIRLQNALNIIDDLGCSPGITNTEIAHNRGLSIPTISNIVNILRNSSIVMTTGTGESSGGRRPVRLSLNPQYQYSIGVSIARHTVYLLLIDFSGEIYEKQRHYIQFEDNDDYWYKIRELITKMQEKVSAPCGVGIALPGFVNEDQTFALGTHTLGTSAMDLEHIHEILGDDVSIDDSCRLAAMAQMFGKAYVEDNFFVLLSRRVSGILIYDRSIFKFKGSSVDVGSMLIDPSQKTAVRGVPGSFYELCSASRIVDFFRANGMTAGYDDFFEEINKGNEEFAGIWDMYLRNLSIAVYNLYAVFKVSIVIGGEMAKYIQPYTRIVDDYVSALSGSAIQDIHLKCSIYGEYDDAYGAALEARSLFLNEKLPEILKSAAAAAPAKTRGKGRRAK